MTDDEFVNRSIDEVRQRLEQAGPDEPRVVHRHGESLWDPVALYTLRREELTVLARSRDVVVFFDEAGNVRGWRDDGRKGTAWPIPASRETFLETVTAELDLPAGTRLGRFRPVRMPPIGWTHEGVLLLPAPGGPRDVLRVWVRPGDLRVIQCLYDRAPDEGGLL